MVKIPSSVLLDVNVWLDNYLPDRPSAPDSRALLDWLEQRDVAIFYPITTPGTVFYVVQQALKHAARLDGVVLNQNDALAIREIAWSCIENMAEIGAPVGADVSDFWFARKCHSIHGDLEDNFVLAAVDRAQVDYFITGDDALLKKAGAAALSPHDFVQLVCIA